MGNRDSHSDGFDFLFLASPSTLLTACFAIPSTPLRTCIAQDANFSYLLFVGKNSKMFG